MLLYSVNLDKFNRQKGNGFVYGVLEKKSIGYQITELHIRIAVDKKRCQSYSNLWGDLARNKYITRLQHGITIFSGE